MTDILLFGSGGHAKVVIDIIEKQKAYNIIGLIDSFKQRGEKTMGYAVLGGENDLIFIASKYNVQSGIVAVGDNFIRSKIVQNVLSKIPAFEFVTALHPSSQIGKDVVIGEGSAIMAQAVINSGSVIGMHCIINSSASVDHDNNIGDFVSIAPGATTGGTVTIGELSVVALGANIIHSITIGANTIVGAGSVTLTDLPDNSVCYGIPAEPRRKRKTGEKYL